MNKKILIPLIFCCTLFILGCTKEESVPKEPTQNDTEIGLDKFGKVTRLSGIGFYAETNECDYQSMGASYALRMTGDLQGCLYAFIEESKCWGNGIYFEKGREYFVGTYKGKPGTFRTTYKFEAKFEGCSIDGTAPTGAEIFGICQHPFVKGSGTGVFDGATGRLDFIDNVKATPINFPYLGHIQF